MSDVFDPAKRSAVMARIKSRDTKPELLLRRLLTGLGARYRLHRKDLPGSPDVAMPGRRLAIFVHGCFWHGHDCARGSRVPRPIATTGWPSSVVTKRATHGTSPT
jgi:DNA mismatch endonuclease (patch repair protein)